MKNNSDLPSISSAGGFFAQTDEAHENLPRPSQRQSRKLPDPFAVSWSQDYLQRANPQLFTRLLEESVPVVKYIGFRIDEVSEGFCRSTLPLNFESTNQHGSHQAALMSLAADYTGGAAFSTLLRGIPIAGIHPGTEDHTAALWLASMNVKYLAPSAGDLTVTCRISADECQAIQQRYFAGRRVLSRLLVNLECDGERVAMAEMAYFAQPSWQLRPTKENSRVSRLFRHKLKASARMIAGLRGGLGGESKLQFHCKHSRFVAGPHGKLLAQRLNRVLPELQDMVLARTQHVDSVLTQGLQNGIQQVVFVGAGLDVRAFGYGELSSRATYFEVDLPEMLEERQRVLAHLYPRPYLKRHMVPMNFETQRLDHILGDHPSFDPRLPTAFIYEGCSMYFDEPTNAAMVLAVKNLMYHPDSFLWIDFVGEDALAGRHDHDGIDAFLQGMKKLGESFVFGTNSPALLLQELGFSRVDQTSSGELFDSSNPVANMYRFVVARK